MARLATGMLLLVLNSSLVVQGLSVVRPPSSPMRPQSGPFVPAPNVLLCDQEELIAVASTLTNLREKQQCQVAIAEKEMMKAQDPLAVCGVPSCVDALQTMYRTLPKCRFRDWNVQFHAEMQLRNCAIMPDDRSPTSGVYTHKPASTGVRCPDSTPEAVATPAVTRDNEMNSPVQRDGDNEERPAYRLR